MVWRDDDEDDDRSMLVVVAACCDTPLRLCVFMKRGVQRLPVHIDWIEVIGRFSQRQYGNQNCADVAVTVLTDDCGNSTQKSMILQHYQKAEAEYE